MFGDFTGFQGSARGAAPAPYFATAPVSQRMQVQVPAGVMPGQAIQVQANGQLLQVAAWGHTPYSRRVLRVGGFPRARHAQADTAPQKSSSLQRGAVQACTRTMFRQSGLQNPQGGESANDMPATRARWELRAHRMRAFADAQSHVLVCLALRACHAVTAEALVCSAERRWARLPGTIGRVYYTCSGPSVPTQVVVPPGCFPGGSFFVDTPAVGGAPGLAQPARAWVAPREGEFCDDCLFRRSSSLPPPP